MWKRWKPSLEVHAQGLLQWQIMVMMLNKITLVLGTAEPCYQDASVRSVYTVGKTLSLAELSKLRLCLGGCPVLGALGEHFELELARHPRTMHTCSNVCLKDSFIQRQHPHLFAQCSLMGPSNEEQELLLRSGIHQWGAMLKDNTSSSHWARLWGTGTPVSSLN